MKKKYDVVIVGSGYTGLTAATELIDKGFSVIVIEKSGFIGGLGSIIKLSNGSFCESFYHHFFTHDQSLIKYTKRFLKIKPTFRETKMSIFFKGKHYSWNGIIDLIKYPHIELIGKFRFILATLLLSKRILSKNFLDNVSLSEGLEKLYGKNSFESVWRPMIKGKFGNKVNNIPLRWMQGRLKQRIESRSSGKEQLGFIEGSLNKLTCKIEEYIKFKNSVILKNANINDIEWDNKNKKYKIFVKHNNQFIKKFTTDKIVFTTPSYTANSIIKNVDTGTLRWNNHNYFTAYCVMLELSESLSDYYWTNIADDKIFFCGYIEQTQLTGIEEYQGLHISYLTKYVYLKKNEEVKSEEYLKEKAYETLKILFPTRNIKNIIKNIHISFSQNAQVITDFNFKQSDMNLMKSYNLFIGNMSNVYPDERSINNAIKVGKELVENIS